MCITGPPDSGKSSAVSAVLEHALQAGLSCLLTNPTSKLVACQDRLRNVRDATINSAFGSPRWSYSEDLSVYAVWLIGEIGMLTKAMGDRIWRTWRLCDKIPLLIFEGDFAQLPPGVGEDQDVRSCTWWEFVPERQLHASHRFRDQDLLAFLQLVRCSRPSMQDLRIFDPFVVGDVISGEVLWVAWSSLPDALVLTTTREAARAVNAIGIALCDGDELGHVTLWDMDEDGLDLQLIPLKFTAKLEISHNLDIEAGLFNGASCTVVARKRGALLVSLQDGSVQPLQRRAARLADGSMRSVFDVRLGYASTVHKVEGATLNEAVVCWEHWSLPGWWYTAVSRLRCLDRLRCIGNPLPCHFEAKE